MNVAQKVRAAKQKHPDDFCPVKGCLWRVYTSRGVNPCQHHPSGAERAVPTVSCPTGEQTTALRADVRGVGPTVAPLWSQHPKDCPKACCNPAF